MYTSQSASLAAKVKLIQYSACKLGANLILMAYVSPLTSDLNVISYTNVLHGI